MNRINTFTTFFEGNKASRSIWKASSQRCRRANIRPKISASFQFDHSLCDRFTWFHCEKPESAFALPACQIDHYWRGQPGGAE